MKWKILQIIYLSVRLAKNQIQANFVFFFIVFIILTVYGHRFLFDFIADEDPDDITQLDVSFRDLYHSSITVFYLLFKFEWTTLAINYLLFNKQINSQGPSFLVETHEFINYIPFSFEIFLIVAILMHLFFTELFVPQLIYFLDISKLLQLKVGHLDLIKSIRFIFLKNLLILFRKFRNKIFTIRMAMESFCIKSES